MTTFSRKKHSTPPFLRKAAAVFASVAAVTAYAEADVNLYYLSHHQGAVVTENLHGDGNLPDHPFEGMAEVLASAVEDYDRRRYLQNNLRAEQKISYYVKIPRRTL